MKSNLMNIFLVFSKIFRFATAHFHKCKFSQLIQKDLWFIKKLFGRLTFYFPRELSKGLRSFIEQFTNPRIQKFKILTENDSFIGYITEETFTGFLQILVLYIWNNEYFLHFIK